MRPRLARPARPHSRLQPLALSGRAVSNASAISLPHFHNEVIERSLHRLEPVRHAGWNHDYVSLGELVGIAAINLATASFAWRAGRRLNHSAASHEGRGALDDVNHVGIIGMNFDLAGL